jgi:hypothetical protein
MKSLSNRENTCNNPLHEACSSFPIAGPVILKTGLKAETVFVNLLRSPGINSQPDGPVQQPYLSYRPAMLHRQVESNPRNRFLVSLNVYKYGLRSRIDTGENRPIRDKQSQNRKLLRLSK